MDNKPKVVVIGLDGATFDQLMPLIGEDRLPSLARMISQGAWGTLRSTVPCTTPPAWSSMLTGTNPGRHGIFDFRMTPHADPSRRLVDLGKMKGLKLWDVLGRGGMTSGFLGVPVMYPPAPVPGWMVCGMMTPSRDVPFTWPAELQHELIGAFPGYTIDVDIPRYDNTFWEDIEIFLDDLQRHTRAQVDAFFHLWERRPTDLLMGVFVATDRIGHLLWKYVDRRQPHYGSAVGRKVRAKAAAIYAMVDELVGRACERAARTGAAVIVMSDHGFGPTEGYFNANRMLEELGLLAMRGEVAVRKRLFARAWEAGDSRLARALLPKALQRGVRGRLRGRRSSFVNDLEPFLDFDRTSAFYASIPCHGIFIRRAGAGAVVAGKAAYDGTRGRIRRALEQARHPDGGPLLSGLWDREELYRGPMTAHAPDVVFAMRDFAVIPRPLLGAAGLYRDMRGWPNGFHRMEGVVVLWGDGIAPRRIEEARMVDIAPTVVARMGLPLPPAMEGRPLAREAKQ